MLRLHMRVIASLVLVTFVCWPIHGYALPTDGNIVYGDNGATIAIDGANPNKLNVGSDTTPIGDRAIIDYTSFSIAAPETVQFYQPGSGSIALNRVTGGSISEILGSLIANGRIFLVNPNGVLFGAGSVVNTAGLIASTLGMTTSNADFMNTSVHSFNFADMVIEGNPGAVINAGTLNSPGGFVALLGPRVENSGAILANIGTIALAAGSAATISLDAANLISVVLTSQSEDNPGDAVAGVINSGNIQAAGGKVLLTADTLNTVFDQSINNAGIVQAKEIEITGNGDIVLTSNSPGAVQARASSGEASVLVQSTEGNIDISNTEVSALIEALETYGNGDAAVDILAGSSESPDSTITITNSEVEADVEHVGSATVNIVAGEYEAHNTPAANGSGPDGIVDYVEHLHGSGHVTIQEDSSIMAEAGYDYSDAHVNVKAQDVDISDSFITALIEDDGEAVIDIFAGDLDYYHAWWDYQNTEFYGGILNVTDSGILASVGSGDTDWSTRSAVELDGYKVTLDGSAVVAQQVMNGLAYVDVHAGNFNDNEKDGEWSVYGGELNILNPVTTFTDNDDMLIIDSLPSVAALVGQDGVAEVELTSGRTEVASTINIADAAILSQVNGIGEASIDVYSGNYEDKEGQHEWGSGECEFESEHFEGGDLYITNSSLTARVLGDTYESGLSDDSEATVELEGSNIYIDNSDLTAEMIGNGDATVSIWAATSYCYRMSDIYKEYEEGDFDYDYKECHFEFERGNGGYVGILNGSSLLAKVEGATWGENEARVEIEAGTIDIIEAPATISAQLTGEGNATVSLYAANDYEKSSKETTKGIWDDGDDVQFSSWESNENYTGGAIQIYDSTLSATASGAEYWNESLVELYAQYIVIDPSIITAQVTGDGIAEVDIEAAYEYSSSESSTLERLIDEDYDWHETWSEQSSQYGGYLSIGSDSTVEATVNGPNYGEAEVFLRAHDIFLGSNPDTVSATVNSDGGYGEATVEMWAGNYSSSLEGAADTNRYDDEIYDLTGSESGIEWLMDGGGTLSIIESSVKAEVNNADYGEAKVYLEGRDIFIDPIAIHNPSFITSKVSGYGEASVEVVAADSHKKEWSREWDDEYYEYGDYEQSWSLWGGYDINIIGSSILAQAGSDLAEVYLSTQAGINIDNSSIEAIVNGDGHAGIYMYDKGNFKYWPELLNDVISGLISGLGGDDEYGNGPVGGSINVTDSTIHAEAASSDEPVGTAIVAMATKSSLNIDNSTVSAEEASDIAAVAMYAGYEINVENDSTVSAESDDYLAAVVGYADNEDTIFVDETSTISADGGEGFGLVALLSPGDIEVPGTITAAGESDVFTFIDEFIGDSVQIGNQYQYGSAVLLGSLYGDIVLGDISADLVVPVTLGGSIYDAGDVNAHYLAMLARGDIGTAPDADVEFPGPINTDVDILSAYSWGEGSIYVNEANSIELGLYLPIYDSWYNDSIGVYEQGEQLGALGASVAANDGIINIVSQGDMLVNSVIAPRGGVFLQSLHGSMYAGHGWYPYVTRSMVNQIGSGLSCLIDNYFDYYISPACISGFIAEGLMDLRNTPWAMSQNVPDYFSPVYLICGDNSGPNIIAGGYSYLSTPEGTIGVGTPGGKNPAISGEVMGIVSPGVEAVTGVYPSPGIDLSRYTPPGLVYFESTEYLLSLYQALDGYDGGYYEGNQIWPETIAEPPVTSENPLWVDVQVRNFGDTRALPQWFLDSLSTPNGSTEVTLFREGPMIAALTLEIGPPLVPPTPSGDAAGQFASTLAKYQRVYYEIVDQYRFVSVEPVRPTTLYGYHPLTPTDSSAFDGITLDYDAYDFIAENLELKKPLPPYLAQ